MQCNFLPALAALDVANNEIRDFGVIAIARCAAAAGKNKLQALNIPRCAFGSPGACGIAVAAVDGYLGGTTGLILD